LNALGRLLAVGSEWAGYATLVPTGGARKAARAAADEASEQLGRQGARQAANSVPRRLARVVEGTFDDVGSKIVSLGRPGSPDVFVTAAADIRRIRTARGLAKKLTLVDEMGRLRKGPFVVIEFDTPWGIATPVFRNNPGFVGRGRTAGGAREFVVPNLPLDELSNPRYYMVR